MNAFVTKRLKIKGTVQGVGFRYSMSAQAESIGVKGWVQNCPDGSVEAVVQGDTEQVEAIINWAKKGPAGARVLSVDISDSPTSVFDDFSIGRGL